MKRHLRELNSAAPWGEYPEVDCAAIRRRVDAALDADSSERRRYMRHKLRVAMALSAAAVVLAGTTLAVAGRWSVLDAYFEGDTSPGAELVDSQPRTLQDENYTLTVESSVSDGSAALLIIRLDARTEEAAAFMRSDDFNGIDLWNVYPVVLEQPADASAAPEAPSMFHAGYGEVGELRTETSTTWRMDVGLSGVDAALIHVRMGYMDKGLSLDLPLTPAEPVTVPVGAAGEGMAWYDVLEDSRVTLDSVSITPLSLRMDVTWAEVSSSQAPLPPILLRMADGTLRTMGQMLESVTEGCTVLETNQEKTQARGCWNLRFRSVQDLSQISGVVAWGREYPLDGGASRAMEVDGHLLPFELPSVNPQLDGIGCCFPVRALCEKLGIPCAWDGASSAASMTWRGVDVELTWGSDTALVDGQPAALTVPVFVQDGEGRVYRAPGGAAQGTLCVEYFPAMVDAWQIWATVPYDNENGHLSQNWVIFP